MTTRLTSVQPAPEEGDALRGALRIAQRPGVRIADGADSVPLTPGLLSVLEAAGSALARGSRAVVVAMEEEVTPAQAAELLGVTRQYVDRLVASGQLPFRRLPGSTYRRIPTEAVLLRLERHDVTTATAAAAGPDDAGLSASAQGGAPTVRGRARRERLVAATARLVAEKGFHGASILEIGAAAGVTGAAIYRHFDNKTQMLVAVFDQVVDELLDGSARIVASELPPSSVLNMLLHHHVRLVLRNPSVFGVYLQESPNLPPGDLTRLRSNQRAYVLRWSHVVKALHPELADDDVRTRVQATFGLLNSLANFPSPMPAETLTQLLMSMARASLTTPEVGPVEDWQHLSEM